MADVAGLSEHTLLRRFQKATGLNPTSYVQSLRVSKAQEMLEQSNISFNQIIWEVGYNDTGAFHKLFQKITRLKPGEYRKRFLIRT